MQSFLRREGIDLLVLGQSGILRSGLLDLPRLGTLNCHPGGLPDLRGVDVVKWALHEQQHPAASLHFVDEGIDTGDIVEVRNVPLQPGDTIEDVESRAVTLSLELLCAGVGRIAAGDQLPRRQDGRQVYLMPPWTERRLRARWPTTRAGLLAPAALEIHACAPRALSPTE